MCLIIAIYYYIFIFIGQYITMGSTGGIEFGVIALVQGFGTVFVDNAYWQRGIGKFIYFMRSMFRFYLEVLF